MSRVPSGKGSLGNMSLQVASPVSPLWVHDSANCVRCGKHYMCVPKHLWTTLDLCWKHSLYEHYTAMCIPSLQVFSVESHFNDLWRSSLLSGEELTSLSKVALCKNEQVKCVGWSQYHLDCRAIWKETKEILRCKALQNEKALFCVHCILLKSITVKVGDPDPAPASAVSSELPPSEVIALAELSHLKQVQLVANIGDNWDHVIPCIHCNIIRYHAIP